MSNKTSLSQFAVDKISNMIFVKKELSPGSKIPNERSLATELGISRTSVREAVKILQSQGVLVVKRGVGTFVADNPGITKDPFGFSYIKNKVNLVKNLFEVRLIIEPEATRLAVERATDEEINTILSHADEVVNVINQNKDFSNADFKFHSSIAKATHNDVIEKFIPSIQESVYSAMTVAEFRGRIESSAQNAYIYHNEICKFIKMRDGNGAMLAMRYHLLKSIDDLTKTTEKI